MSIISTEVAKDSAATNKVTMFNPSVITKVRSNVCIDNANNSSVAIDLTGSDSVVDASFSANRLCCCLDAKCKANSVVLALYLVFVVADVAVVLYQVTLSLLVGSNLNLLVLLANLISFLSG